MDASPEPMRPQGIDITVLPALLARLGSADAHDVRRQLGADLVKLRAVLDQALRPHPHVLAIARQAHVLIALAGTAGAGTLTALARGLLDAAHAGDVRSCAAMGPGIMPEIQRLVDFVQSCPVPFPQSGPMPVPQSGP